MSLSNTAGCKLNGHGDMPPLIMNLAMPVSLSPSLSRKRERGAEHRYARYMLKQLILIFQHGIDSCLHGFHSTLKIRHVKTIAEARGQQLVGYI